MKDVKKLVLKDLKKKGKAQTVIRKIKAENDLEKIAFILFDFGMDRIVENRYGKETSERYFEKWIKQFK